MAPQKKNTEWKPEKFPQPQTYPSGWDSSALFASNGQQAADSKQETPKKETQTDWKPEKFPKPRTFPRCWSVDD